MTHLRFASLLLCLPLLTACGITPEQRLRAALEKANTCNQPEECVLIGSKCPFGCEIYVHRDRAEELRARVAQFESTCVYGCATPAGVECRNNRCEPLIGHRAARGIGDGCATHTDCSLPPEYALRSSCPFETRCIEATCAAVCPLPDPFSIDGTWGVMRCETDNQCDCSGYIGRDATACRCVDGGCVAVVE
jgi:hypothetical protein